MIFSYRKDIFCHSYSSAKDSLTQLRRKIRVFQRQLLCFLEEMPSGFLFMAVACCFGVLGAVAFFFYLGKADMPDVHFFTAQA
jgi:hypothetical protein